MILAYPPRPSRRKGPLAILGMAGFCTLLSACGSPYDPGSRAGSGALIGGGAGAAIGALAGGGRGAAIGALAGGLVGAAGGAATTPNRPGGNYAQSGYYNQGGYSNQAPPQQGYQQPYYNNGQNGYAAPAYPTQPQAAYPAQQGYPAYNQGYGY
ncbi:hypothetical protein [Asaia bogorensis]|uniref:hypothetical protein n=1 Tax=Asaia bogorensis TaxID=91915 RepID=UPI001F120322|nr:hypothetical protein [Asaia bogorensis]